MSDHNKDVPRHHNFDGIQEYDNDLPRWWVNLFLITIVFGVVYLAWFHWPIGGGKNQDEEFMAALAENKQQVENHQRQQPTFDYAGSVKDPAILEKGSATFKEVCAACHGQAGQGGVGPNLTDDFWIYGANFATLEEVVTKGKPEKGMPAWGEILGIEKVRSAIAFIGSIQHTNPPDAKAPQGEPGILK